MSVVTPPFWIATWTLVGNGWPAVGAPGPATKARTGGDTANPAPVPTDWGGRRGRDRVAGCHGGLRAARERRDAGDRCRGQATRAGERAGVLIDREGDRPGVGGDDVAARISYGHGRLRRQQGRCGGRGIAGEDQSVRRADIDDQRSAVSRLAIARRTECVGAGFVDLAADEDRVPTAIRCVGVVGVSARQGSTAVPVPGVMDRTTGAFGRRA